MAGCGHGERRTFTWDRFLFDLHANCPTIEILEIGDDNWTVELPEKTLPEWPPLFCLRILRFTSANHETITLFLNKIVAPNLELVEVAGSRVPDHSEIEIDDFKPPAIELPNGINWCLRFKDTALDDIWGTLEAIQTQTWPVVEIDLMGLVPQDTLAVLFANSRGSRVGFPGPTPTTPEQDLEIGWDLISDHVPSVTWVIRGPHQEKWVPLVQDRPASLDEAVEYMLGTFARRIEL